MLAPGFEQWQKAIVGIASDGERIGMQLPNSIKSVRFLSPRVRLVSDRPSQLETSNTKLETSCMPKTFTDLVALMDRLRDPGGCPWDREQTYATLAPMLLEE